MKTIACNFGVANWAWPDCLATGTVCVMDDVRVHDFYLAGDRDGYVRRALEVLKLDGAEPVVPAVAAKWYGLVETLLRSDGDLWVHKEGERLFWTISTDAEPTRKVVPENKPRYGGVVSSWQYRKQCTGWSDRDRKGRPLVWGAIHPKAKGLLVTQGTFLTLTPDNALYVQTLVDGGDLSRWHNLPEWKTKEAQAKTAKGTTFDARRKTIVRIAMTVLDTAAGSGVPTSGVRKDKLMGFATQMALEAYIAELMDANEMTCALTGVEMQFDDGPDPALRVSLDRIDSAGHYERGNLQLVCKFANFWKGAQPDAEFRRLVDIVRAVQA
jgi:hypothetical protein